MNRREEELRFNQAPVMIASLTLKESIRSWFEDVVARPLTLDLLGHVVPGALHKYDLPDLASALAPRNVIVLKENHKGSG